MSIRANAGRVRMPRGDRAFNTAIMVILAFVVIVTVYPV